MSVAARLAGFALVLLVAFGLGALAGGVIDPARRTSDAPAAHAEAESHGADVKHDEAAPAAVRGLAVADDGLRLDLRTPAITPGSKPELRFRVLDARGTPVRAYDLEHERRMHVIVVRRDLRGFQHIHPRLAADGTWRAPLTIAEPGSYRVFADFSHTGTARTLAADLRVPGSARLADLPAPTRSASAGGGLRAQLAAAPLRAGRETTLRFTLDRGGRPVAPQPYLGARGHLVALREGDLAFLHVHPVSDDAADFEATLPTPGRYRLFLQVRVDGAVRTAPFTVEVPR
ncbi:MAG: hypothetical protein JHC95_04120 [Solirubrobacteraceae bacterium]|nr:hypothetical protein [Solirubrobacteraceae bacterium]